MRYTAKQYAAALHEALSETRDEEKVLDNFAAVLMQNGDNGLMDQIESEYGGIARLKAGITEATVRSAKPLDRDTGQLIVDKLNEHIKGEVELKKRVDEGLLGGAVIRVGDEMIDASVKKSLSDLQKELVK